jgi:hypothetical protein
MVVAEWQEYGTKAVRYSQAYRRLRIPAQHSPDSGVFLATNVQNTLGSSLGVPLRSTCSQPGPCVVVVCTLRL